MSTQATTFDLHQVFDQARKGDDGAFGRLVERYKNLVFSVALGILGDVEAARDVTQGVFLTAWQRLRELRSASSIPPWLRETARRQALYHLRGKVRERARSEQAPPLLEASPNADAQLIERQDARALELALDQLPAEAREVLLLYYSEEQSVAQVASLLDLSEAAVKKRLQRGRTLLREGHAQVLSSKTARVAPGAALVAAILASLRGVAQAAPRPRASATTGMTGAAAVVLVALLVVGAVLARNHRAAGPAGPAATAAVASAPTPTGPVSSAAGAPPTRSGSSHPRGPANAAASKPAASITAEAAPSDCDDKGGLVVRRAWAIAHGQKPAEPPSPPSEIERRLEQAYVEWWRPVAAHQRGEPVDEAAYRQMSASWREAVTWLIPRCSASRAMTTPEMQPRLGEGDAELERLWLAEAATHPQNARVQYNTAVFVQRSSPDRARPFFERAAQLEPENGEWSFALAGMERDRARGGSAEARQEAQQNSIGYYEHALSKARSPRERVQVLGQLAKAAIEVGEDGIADQRAREELELVPSLHGFMVPNTLHEGHILLGELALRRNDDALAARELMTAAEVDGSPTLNSFGPNTELAQKLLARGQRDVVIHYLERVGRFWKGDCLAPWLVALRAGETPDFAAGHWDCNTRVAR